MPDAWLMSTRLALYLGLMLGFGLPVFVLHALRDDPTTPVVRRLFRVSGAASVLALVASGAALWVMARSMSADGDPASVWTTTQTLLTQTALGTTWVIRVVLLMSSVAIVARPIGSALVRAGALAVLGAVALATLAWAGHGAMNDGVLAWLHLGADITHLLAAGVWVGSLVALALIARQASISDEPTSAHLLSQAASGFAQLGSVIVGTLLISGTINYVLIVGPSLSELVEGVYGRVLLAKLVVFGGMLSLAAINRFRLAPVLEQALHEGDTPRAVMALKRSLWTETGLVLVVLTLVAGLGLLNPATASDDGVPQVAAERGM
ncbi:MAG: copper homeostasis membrane protein CopD [Proteobacteria bacterium]|nr:copper homeostasis membrane protein CopD [Pseudomonadota bacterium]